MRRTAGIIILLGILLVISNTVYAAVTVDFVDVGQGDAILISLPDGDHILIDGGGEKQGKALLIPYLKRKGVTELTLVIATHPHADHIGGLIPVLNQFPVREVWLNGQIHTTRTYERFLQEIQRQKIPARRARKDLTADFSGIDQFVVIHPKDPLAKGLNDNSVVILMRVGRISFLLTGDIEIPVENALLDQGALSLVTVLKVAHHGSDSSTSEQFGEVVSPQVAIISAGKDNSFGHPSREVVKRLISQGSQVFGTYQEGTIRIISDGESYQVETFPTAVSEQEKIDFTTATAEELQRIPGIGAVLAQRIVEYREANEIKQLADFIEVKGIGPKLLTVIEEYGYLD